LSATDDFFDERTDQSEVKSRIVLKFFASWSKVIVQQAKKFGKRPRLAYVDLFAGPGRYVDGAQSTPLMIMQHALETPDLAENLVTTFNDMDEDHAASLEAALRALPDFKKLKTEPLFFSDRVDNKIEELFEKANLVPTFSFIDPFGYKGLTIRLIRALAKDWGSDCVFFFNYSRINSAITNDSFRPHMEALFGIERLGRMRVAVGKMKPWERVEYTLEMVAEVLKEQGFGFSLAFRFKNESGTRTTHALIYVTKHPLGFAIMKQIMAKESSTAPHGVPSYIYCPADAAAPPQLEFVNPIEKLANELFFRMAGTRTTVGDLIKREEPTTRFLEKNYRDAIIHLELNGRLVADPPLGVRRRGTCGPNVVLTFSCDAGA